MTIIGWQSVNGKGSAGTDGLMAKRRGDVLNPTVEDGQSGHRQQCATPGNGGGDSRRTIGGGVRHA
jgi:hypothetical protein